jgi:lysophospholipase L1-like esterase
VPRSRISPRFPSALAAAVVGAALVVGGAGSAAAQGPPPPKLNPAGAKVATLGDSYASGEGAPAAGATPWVSDVYGDSGADGCHRSALSGHTVFGAGLLRGDDKAYVNASCSGATTVSLVRGFKGERSQLDALGPRTKTVTLSIGGNDAGFSSVATACNTVAVVPGAPSCQAALAGSAAALRALTTAPAGGTTPLERTYRAVLAKAPHAVLVVTGYPLLFPTGAASPRCDVIQPAARAAINNATRQLNAAAMTATAAVGGLYVDLVRPFSGHSSCEADPAASWINTIVPRDPVLSFHPDATGQAAVAARLQEIRCFVRPGR